MMKILFNPQDRAERVTRVIAWLIGVIPWIVGCVLIGMGIYNLFHPIPKASILSAINDSDPLFWYRLAGWGAIIFFILTAALMISERAAYLRRGVIKETIRENLVSEEEGLPVRPLKHWLNSNDGTQSVRQLTDMTPMETLYHLNVHPVETVQECSRLLKEYKGDEWEVVRLEILNQRRRLQRAIDKDLRSSIETEEQEADFQEVPAPSPTLELSVEK